MQLNEIAKAIIEEHTVDGFCTLSKKKLGELLHHRHPDLFNSPERGRASIRAVTGSYGDIKRKTTQVRAEWNGFKLPEQEKNDYSKVILNEKRIGILSDIHFPYADITALNAAVKYLISFNPDCIILNGDTIDMYHGSDFEQDPRNRKPDYEFAMVRFFLCQLHELFPNTRIIYKAGNHCERYEKKIMQRLPYFVDLKWMNLEFALNYEMPFKVEVVKNKRIIKAGHLNILHGHEFAKGFIAPVNVARGFYLRSKANVIAGHHHRISNHRSKDLNGKQISAWSTGCLCELNPKYMPINEWQHGFATVEIISNDGNFRVNNIEIIDGEIA
jgi:predicted phosphodiesterase